MSIELYNEDCMVRMKKIDSESIDCVITDPPYNISQNNKFIYRDVKKYRWKRHSNIKLDFGEWDKRGELEYFEFTELWFSECCRILKTSGWIYIFFDKQKTGYFDLLLAPKYEMKARSIYTWVKSNPTPSFRKVNWNSGTEHIWVGSKGESKLKNFKYQKFMNNYYISPNASAYGKTEHPTEKPLDLMLHLIQVNSNEGDTILDPFMGSGTTGVACKELNRNFIGIEISETYYKIACERIKNTTPPLF